MKEKKSFGPIQYILAWGVHAFTAMGAFLGLLTLYKIYQHEYLHALWIMGITIIIDALDGTMARQAHVKLILPNFDGALLDNIVDYLNYVITPCFFLLIKPDMLPQACALWIVGMVILTSSYQFCQADAKTPDHFFKGFPCYWNITIFYMTLFNTAAITNVWLLILFSVLIFVPIKYVYPSRLDYLTESKPLKRVMHGLSIVYGISSGMILWQYPNVDMIWLILSLLYIGVYLFSSFYRTYSPMIKAKISAHRNNENQ